MQERAVDAVEIADVHALRRKANYDLLAIANTEVYSIDPWTGERVYSGGAPGSELRLPNPDRMKI